MALKQYGKYAIDVDGDGFMTDPSSWTEELAAAIAKDEDLMIAGDLTEDHWKIIHSIRNHYLEHGIAPTVRAVCKETGLKLMTIFELFPTGPARGACRVAGLPKPEGCV
jgi:tRNA 2-thiouridine synthesizing protein E